MTKALIYIRVSTQEQVMSGLSLGAQEQICRDHCARKGYEVIEPVIADPAVTGSLPLHERKGGRQLVDLATGGDVTVVALCQDRLFRNIVDCMATLERWEELGVTLETVDGGLVSIEDPEDFLKAGIFALFAEYERRKGRQRTKRAMARMKAEGRKPGPPRFGFKATGRKGVHEIDPQTSAALVRIGELRKSLKKPSFNAIAKALNAEGYRTQMGGPFSHNTVSRVAR